MISHITSQETWNGIRDGQDIVQMLEAFRIGGGGGKRDKQVGTYKQRNHKCIIFRGGIVAGIEERCGGTDEVCTGLQVA